MKYWYVWYRVPGETKMKFIQRKTRQSALTWYYFYKYVKEYENVQLIEGQYA